MDLKKRYWLFIYSDYYPGGGISDLKTSYDNLIDCFKIIHKEVGGYDQAQILDIETGYFLEIKKDEEDYKFKVFFHGNLKHWENIL